MASASALRPLTAKRRALFLAALAQHGNVTHAAREAGFTRQAAHWHRDHDPDFAVAWDDALEQAADVLEHEAYRRAHDGVPEPLVSMGKLVCDAEGVPVTVQKYSDNLLALLLKGARPAKYRDNNVNVTAQSQSLGITVVLEQMRDDRTISEHAAEFVGLLDAAPKTE